MNSLSSKSMIIIIIIITVVIMGSITIPITILYSETYENKANTTTIASLSIGPTITQRSEIITAESTPDMTEIIIFSHIILQLYN